MRSVSCDVSFQSALVVSRCVSKPSGNSPHRISNVCTGISGIWITTPIQRTTSAGLEDTINSNDLILFRHSPLEQTTPGLQLSGLGWTTAPRWIRSYVAISNPYPLPRLGIDVRRAAYPRLRRATDANAIQGTTSLQMEACVSALLPFFFPSPSM
ncbi:hypothetical protein EI94DRAFT_1749762 [Lactarius quietus]|nr:hypothetical protein EI94DRAFT_1749762 [Lactarius quietus]